MSDDTNNVKFLEEERPRSAKIISGVIEGSLLLVAVALILVIRMSWLETAIVVSGSMKPALQVNARVVIDHRASLRGSWKRGDIILFRAPANWPLDTYVKRIIAVPGDIIQLVNGQVYVNGQLLKEPYLAQKPLPENYGPWQMGPGHYFVMGDNRNDSEDSRDHGPVPDSDIEGRAIFQLWPLSRFGKIP